MYDIVQIPTWFEHTFFLKAESQILKQHNLIIFFPVGRWSGE